MMNNVILIIYTSIAFVITIILFGIVILLNKFNIISNEKKLSYETGCIPLSFNNKTIDLQFYIIAILFLILDIEILLLFPWMLSLKKLGLFGFYSVSSLWLILGIGFFYEWFNNGLKFKKN